MASMHSFDHSFDDKQVMFTLAMVSYRGLEIPGSGTLHDIWLRHGMQQGLDTLAPVRGDWEIVWGPATYSAPFGLFDDSAAYVARHRSKRSRYVIAVRGTNAFSLFDWVFGDLWTGWTQRWAYGDPARDSGAALSLSTALGLEGLLNMKGTRPLPGLLGSVERVVSRDVVRPLERGAREWLQPLTTTLQGLRAQLGGPLLGDLRSLGEQFVSGPERELEAQIQGIRELQNLASWRRTRRRINDFVRGDSGEVPGALFALLESASWLSGELHFGESLLSFLSDAAKQSKQRGKDPFEVFVTGHSKGGALAPALALLLAETQGKAYVSRRMRWNPAGHAHVHCYGYAGPTPGNRAFANRVDRVLQDRMFRIANTNDVVPHAWAVSTPGQADELTLQQVPTLYDDVVRQGPLGRTLLQEICDRVSEDVGHLGYAHPGSPAGEFQGKLDDKSTSFPAQVLHQHVNGYIEGLGLAETFSMMDLFGGSLGGSQASAAMTSRRERPTAVPSP
jgi:hypothetical protein